MKKKEYSIGIDIGKKKCDVCVMDSTGKVLERRQYHNTPQDAKEFENMINHPALVTRSGSTPTPAWASRPSI